jgi:hypothetical protein
MFSLFDIPLSPFYPVRQRRRYSPYRYPRYSRWYDPYESYDYEDDYLDDFFNEPFFSYHVRYPQRPQEPAGQLKSDDAAKAKQAETPKPKPAPAQTPAPIVIVSSRKSIFAESDSRGFEHVKEEIRDAKSGKTIYAETRRIGDQSMTLHRETDKDGKVTERESRTNIPDDQVETFKSKWMEYQHPGDSETKPIEQSEAEPAKPIEQQPEAPKESVPAPAPAPAPENV